MKHVEGTHLDVQPSCTHRRKLSHCYSPLPNRHILHMSSLPRASLGRVSGYSWSSLKVRSRSWLLGGSTYQIKPFLFQPIHDNLEELVRRFVELFFLAFLVDVVQPFLICEPLSIYRGGSRTATYLVRPYHIRPGWLVHSPTALDIWMIQTPIPAVSTRGHLPMYRM